MRRRNVFNDMSEARMSRRRLLAAAGVAGVGLAGLGLVGCGSNDSSGSTPAAGKTPASGGTPKKGGVLRNGSPGMPGSLDPHGNESPFAFAKLYDTLYNIDFTTQKVIPRLATSIENPDPTTFIFKLRQGAKWPNVAPMTGRAVTAEDWVYSWNRRTDYVGKANKALQKEYTQKVEAVDANTFKVTLKKPFGPAYNEMGDYSYAVVAKEAVDKYGDLSRNGGGCGPFLLVSIKEGETWEFKRNPEYYDPALPYLEGMTFKVIAENAAATAAFLGKQIDVNSAQLDDITYKDLLKTNGVVGNKIYTLWTAPMYLNCTKAPFKDGRVRRAMQIGWNRPELIQKVVLGEGDADGPIPVGQTYWAQPKEELDKLLAYDLQTAKQLMDAAGYKSGIDVTYPVMNLSAMPDKLTPYLPAFKEFGVNLQLSPEEAGKIVMLTIPGKKWDACSFWDNPSDNPDYNMSRLTTKGPQGTGNLAGYSNAELDKMLDDARAKLKIDERKAAYQAMAKKALELDGDVTIPIVYMITGYQYSAYWDYVRPDGTVVKFDDGSTFTTAAGRQISSIGEAMTLYTWMSNA